MRIAFVGKGGSGKTSLSVLYSHFVGALGNRVVLVDADLNLHAGSLLSPDFVFPSELYLSQPKVMQEIRTYLRGKNHRITDLSAFVKTTPPTSDSNFIHLDNINDPIVQKFSIPLVGLRLMTVGTYDSAALGTSCYHNNLGIFENILSHTIDESAWLIADMVAGIDAFANTLYTQFDLVVLVVEPTRRGVEVVKQFLHLAECGEILETLVVVGNKIRTPNDDSFLRREIPSELYLGSFIFSDYMLTVDQSKIPLESNMIEDPNRCLLSLIHDRINSQSSRQIQRMTMLHDLHRRYVAQSYISERFGDLSNQIDPNLDLSSNRRLYEL